MYHRASGTVAWGHVALFVALALGLGLVPFALVRGGADQLLLLIAYGSPALASWIVRKLVAGEGFVDAHRGLRSVPVKYWVLAALLPVAWRAAAALFDALGGSCELHADRLVSGLPGWLLRWPLAWPKVALVVAFEELGWRSYLVEKLRPAGPSVAFGLCGLVWFAWHPQVWFGAQATWLGGATYLVAVLCLSFIFGWLYHSAGSVWPCVLMHVAHNTASPHAIEGALTCAAEQPVVPGVLVSLFLTAIVLWRAGGFDREPALTVEVASGSLRVRS